jgi:N-acetyl-D-muramate 6-phosphate phosphatase
VTSRAVLFDFDGTLADSAADLAAALNVLRERRGLAAMTLEEARPYCSSGARGLLRVGFGLTPESPQYRAMRAEFLAEYERRICVHTSLFPGMRELLDALETRGVPWGIATNKAARFTGLLVPALQLKPACVVCGDSTPHLKPHPAMLLLAAQHLNLPCEQIAYVGDDLRDVQAARAAEMRSIAVEYGYHGTDHGGPRTWNADAVISHPEELLEHL